MAEEAETEHHILLASTVAIEPSEVSKSFGSDFLVEALPSAPRKISGQEIEVAFFISLTANAVYFGVQTLVEKLLKAIRGQREEALKESGFLTVTISGASITLRSEAELQQLENVIAAWVQAQKDAK